MKYDYKEFGFPLAEGMENVEKIYKKYLLNQDDERLYDELKFAIYDLSLDIKSERVCGHISAGDADEMKEYYWSLLL